MRHIEGMKVLISSMLFVLFVQTLLSGCVSQQAGSVSLHEGAAIGYRGLIRVRVSMEQGTMTDIIVIESSEDRAVGGAAIEELIELALMYNTTELDVISGATETSKGFLAALENAVLY